MEGNLAWAGICEHYIQFLGINSSALCHIILPILDENNLKPWVDIWVIGPHGGLCYNRADGLESHLRSGEGKYYGHAYYKRCRYCTGACR